MPPSTHTHTHTLSDEANAELATTSAMRDRATVAAEQSAGLAEERQRVANLAVERLATARRQGAAAEEQLKRLRVEVAEELQRLEAARVAAESEEARADRAAKRLEALTFKVAEANKQHAETTRDAEVARGEYVVVLARTRTRTRTRTHTHIGMHARGHDVILRFVRRGDRISL